jgi:DUF4097 and DUF4098 domain-containing protein YvlB
MNSKDLRAYTTSGEINLLGSFTGNNKLRSVSGNVTMNIAGSKNDYNRTLSSVSGNIHVNGVKSGSDSNNSASNNIDLSVTSGNIDIRFN